MLADPIATNSRLGTYTNFVNLLDMCGIAVPTGKRSDGLPMSVTLLASAGKDAADRGTCPRHPRRERLDARRDRMGAARRRLPGSRTQTTAIEMAVVGAHLSGMPLNGQLTRLGARFCREQRGRRPPTDSTRLPASPCPSPA